MEITIPVAGSIWESKDGSIVEKSDNQKTYVKILDIETAEDQGKWVSYNGKWGLQRSFLKQFLEWFEKSNHTEAEPFELAGKKLNLTPLLDEPCDTTVKKAGHLSLVQEP